MKAQPDVVICGRDTVWLHCQHSPDTSACCQHGHDCGDRNVRCPCRETGEFYSKQRWTPPIEVTLIQLRIKTKLVVAVQS